jgi:hypothetical protein
VVVLQLECTQICIFTGTPDCTGESGPNV